MRTSPWAVAGPILFGVVVTLAAALRPGYSHVTQLISELGETGTGTALLMNVAGFVPTTRWSFRE
jgi:hypothetical protein